MRLTKKTIEAAEPGEADYFLWDDDVPGFGLRVYPSGTKSFLLQYRQGARTRRLKLGRYPVLSPEEARRLAIRRLAEALEGKDPRAKPKASPTLQECAERFLTEYVPYKASSTQREYRRLLEDVILPCLGNKCLSDITPETVAAVYRGWLTHPAQANKAVAVLSRLFTLYGEGHNPCRGIKSFKERPRRRYLSPEELTRLGEVLRRHEDSHPAQVLAIRLLLLTGCRLNEILTLKWENVDVKRGLLHLPHTKTGERDVYLGSAAVELLKKAPRLSEWVIPGRDPSRPLVNLTSFFRRICQEAKLKDLRIHDLRHTHASFGVGSGLSLYLVGGLLGHKQAATTQRYAHLMDDPLREAAERVTESIAACLDEGTDRGN